jgi:hypothetical protein
MKTTPDPLTQREQQYLEHVRQAKAQGLALAQYCRARGLRVQSLYNIQHQLRRKSTLSRRSAGTKQPKQSGDFIAMRVEPKPAAPAPTGVCQLRHPSGWTLECTSWPQASWMSEFLNGGTHVAT